MAPSGLQDETHVLIVGGGITGLILAQGLKRTGIKYSIFERDASLNVRSNEWTMAIHWSLDHLESVLPAAIYQKMEAASCNPDVPIEAGGDYPIIHGETGRLLAGVPYAKGLRVPRSQMRALCASGIDVQFGKTLVDIAFDEGGAGVTAMFSDGTRVHGTTLVGADGPRSKVREYAVGSAKAASVESFPICHHNLTVCYGDATKARFLRERFPTSYLALSDRSFHAFQSISSMPGGPDQPEKWIFHLAMAWNGTADHASSNAERLARIKERAQTLGEPARSAFMWIPENTQVQKADISYWITQPWDNRKGRLTLVGDAAHPMPPYRGQGLNHCICDVHHLLDALRQSNEQNDVLETRISAYEEEVVARGSEEVKCSLQNGKMLHDWEQVKRSPVFTQGFRPMKGHDSYGNDVRPGEEHEAIEVST